MRQPLNYQDITPRVEGLPTIWNWAKTQPKRTHREWNNHKTDKDMYGFRKK